MFSKVSLVSMVVVGRQVAPRRLDDKIYGEHKENMYFIHGTVNDTEEVAWLCLE